MKAYALDLRERVVKFIQTGGSKAEAGRHFELGRSTVYRYLAAVKTHTLAPKTSWGSWRKLDPAKLHAYVKSIPPPPSKSSKPPLPSATTRCGFGSGSSASR